MIVIAALPLMLASVQPGPLPAEPESEIVVLLNRVRTIEVTVSRDHEGRWHCGLGRSTGRPKLDERLCRAVTKCVQKGAADQGAVQTCIRSSRAGLVREIERTMKRKAS